jgi:hypothetical protein
VLGKKLTCVRLLPFEISCFRQFFGTGAAVTRCGSSSDGSGTNLDVTYTVLYVDRIIFLFGTEVAYK